MNKTLDKSNLSENMMNEPRKFPISYWFTFKHHWHSRLSISEGADGSRWERCGVEDVHVINKAQFQTICSVCKGLYLISYRLHGLGGRRDAWPCKTPFGRSQGHQLGRKVGEETRLITTSQHPASCNEWLAPGPCERLTSNWPAVTPGHSRCTLRKKVLQSTFFGASGCHK